MNEKPKRKSSASSIKIIISAVVGLVLLCAVFFVGIFTLVTKLLEPASTVTHSFMEAINDDEYQVAFDLFSSDLKTEIGNAEQLRILILENDVKPESWSFTSQNVENNFGRFTGQVTLENGKSTPIAIFLVIENDEWRITGFEWGNDP
jgi:hypothetical protein